MKYKSIKRNKKSNGFFKILIQVSLLITLVTLIQKIQIASGESKEFDWGELGVSLASPKNHLGSLVGNGGGSLSNNLRILVSPQRRISKK